MTHKLIAHSVMMLRNEAEDVIGIIKEGLFFAQNVWCIIDPDSTDGTEDLIQKTFPTTRVHIQHQIKNPAMVDESYQGKLHDGEGCLAMHWNTTYWVNKIVKPGEWWHWVAADERFAPKDYAEILYWIRYAQVYGFEAIYTDDHLFIQEEKKGTKFDWCIKFKHPGTPHHFLRMPETGWKKGEGIHTGCTLPPMDKRFKMPVSHYHFAYVKETRIPFVGPRDHSEYLIHPRYQFHNPMGEMWKTLPELDCEGNFVQPLIIKIPEISFQNNPTEDSLRQEKQKHEDHLRKERARKMEQERLEYLKKNHLIDERIIPNSTVARIGIEGKSYIMIAPWEVIEDVFKVHNVQKFTLKMIQEQFPTIILLRESS